jgi:alkylation response protein AidB-like acyl-CoA dehydrogenase
MTPAIPAATDPAFTEEQHQLRTVAREFLTKRCPESETRRVMDTEAGVDLDVWAQLAVELGLCGLAVPETYGGSGGTFADVAVVLEELGRSLACLPYFSSVVLAQSLLLCAGDEAAAACWLPELASGVTRGAVACTEEGARWDKEAATTTAERVDGRWMVSGSRNFVIDGHTADVLFLAARTGTGTSLFAIDAAAQGLTRTPLPAMDFTRKQARLDLADVPAQLVGQEDRGWPVLTRVLELAALGLSVESLGGAQTVLDMSVEHAKTRVQFGRPIGSFQAIKHRCADALVEIELARSAVYYALTGLDGPADARAFAASLAKATGPDAFFEAAAATIQVHGGIGFTWEHPAHLYFRRAKTSQLMFGDSILHREKLGHFLSEYEGDVASPLS